MHLVTPSYYPQLNSVAQRKNRPILEMTRSMLMKEKQILAKAIAYAIHLLNSYPTKTIHLKTLEKA